MGKSARTRTIEDFAATLSRLRTSVGTPSFRAMAGRSGAISHTTLHEAAQGNRLPSWETTVEFVRACGADPEDYRDCWRRAREVVGSARSAPATRAPRAGAMAPCQHVPPVTPAGDGRRGDNEALVPSVPVFAARPGELVGITVSVMTPHQEAHCLVHFTVPGSRHVVASPGDRPISFQVIVDDRAAR